jgi:hypothetical protein
LSRCSSFTPTSLSDTGSPSSRLKDEKPSARAYAETQELVPKIFLLCFRVQKQGAELIRREAEKRKRATEKEQETEMEKTIT